MLCYVILIGSLKVSGCAIASVEPRAIPCESASASCSHGLLSMNVAKALAPRQSAIAEVDVGLTTEDGRLRMRIRLSLLLTPHPQTQAESAEPEGTMWRLARLCVDLWAARSRKAAWLGAMFLSTCVLSTSISTPHVLPQHTLTLSTHTHLLRALGGM